MTRIHAVSVCTLLLVAPSSFANEKAYQRCVRGAVMIVAGSSRASGVVVDKEKRLIVTANHVTAGQSGIDVVFPIFDQNGAVITETTMYADRKSQMRARVIYTDQSRDVSVIQVDSLPPQVEAVPLAKSPVRPGQDIHCIGNAAFRHGGLFGYSYGKVRNVFRRQVNGQLNGKMIVETQIPTNKGDSGGPIFNDNGELVAIVSQGTTGVTPPQNDPFHAMQVVDHSVDVSEIRNALEQAARGAPSVVGGGGNRVFVVQFGGELTNTDPMLNNRFTKTHIVKLDGGVTYIISLKSNQFDTYLRLQDAKGARIIENDDGGDGTNSRIEYQPSSTGDYRLIVTTYPERTTGGYTLDVEKQ